MGSVWTSTEKDELKVKYGCAILIECGSIDQVKSNYPHELQFDNECARMMPCRL